jgi:hypothetical protein
MADKTSQYPKMMPGPIQRIIDFIIDTASSVMYRKGIIVYAEIIE